MLLTLTCKDASGQCVLITSETEEVSRKPHFKVTLSSRSDVSSHSGHGLNSINSLVNLSDPSDTIGEEGQGLLKLQNRGGSLGLPPSVSDHTVGTTTEPVPAPDAKLNRRLSLAIPNFRP